MNANSLFHSLLAKRTEGEPDLKQETASVPSQGRSACLFPGQSSRGGVLLVEDEANVRMVVRQTLEKAGYHVFEAENGEKAMEIITSGEHPLMVDVILLDIRMPRVHGIEAIAYFQREFPRVPLIVLTGFPDLAMATSLMKRGILDYLVKPATGLQITNAVAKAMEQRQYHGV